MNHRRLLKCSSFWFGSISTGDPQAEPEEPVPVSSNGPGAERVRPNNETKGAAFIFPTLRKLVIIPGMHFTSGNLPLSMHLCGSSAGLAGPLPGRWGRRDDRAELGGGEGPVLSLTFGSQRVGEWIEGETSPQETQCGSCGFSGEDI